MRRQRVPDRERHPIVDRGRARLAPRFLGRDLDARHRDEGTFLFRPDHRSVLDRHGLGVGPQLDPELPDPALGMEMVDEAVAKAVRPAAHIKFGILEPLQRVGGRGERKLRDMLAVAEGRLAVARSRRADGSSGGRRPISASRSRHRRPRSPAPRRAPRSRKLFSAPARDRSSWPAATGSSRGRRVQRPRKAGPLTMTKSCVGASSGARCSPSAPITFSASPRHRDRVVEDVAGIGRDPQDRLVPAGHGEQPLRIGGRQPVQHREVADEQRAWLLAWTVRKPCPPLAKVVSPIERSASGDRGWSALRLARAAPARGHRAAA